MEIQFLNPNITEEDIKKVAEVIKTGWITYGSSTKAFEQKFARYVRAKGAVFNSSGTAALHVALLAAGIGSGDEVITTPLSYVATSNVILYTGARVVFVDVDPETGLMDLNKLEKAVNQRTKAIIPIHLYGQMVDMKRLKKIADKNKSVIIEDACHAIEAERDKVKPGELSFAACFSFHAAKNITCGEGGIVTTRFEKKTEELRLLCEGGVEKKNNNRYMITLGYKYSGTNFQAALLLDQLGRIGKQWQERKKMWHFYAKNLADVKGISFPKIMPGVKHAYHMFVVWVNPKKRDEFRQMLLKQGIQTSIHFNPIHLEPYYKKTFGYSKGDLPIAERLGLSTISLPLHLKMNEKEQLYVIEKVKSLVANE